MESDQGVIAMAPVTGPSVSGTDVKANKVDEKIVEE